MDLLKKNDDIHVAPQTLQILHVHPVDGCISRITFELGKFTNCKALFSAVLTVFRKIFMET